MPVTRRSLHRQSVMRSAGASTYTNDTDAKVVHWVRQWVSPQQSPNVVSAPSEKRAQTPADAEKGTPASTPVSLSNLNFKVKQWIPDPDQEAHVPLKYGSTEDVIAFVTEVYAPVEVKNDNDLTASDIRGAVGGEAIPGMTTMDKQGDEDKPAEPAAATAEDALNNTTVPEANTAVDSTEMVVDAPEPAAVVTETTTTTEGDAMEVDAPAETVVETKEEVVPEPAAEPKVEPTEATVTAAPTETPAAAVEAKVEAPAEGVPEAAPVVAEETTAAVVEPVAEPAPETAPETAPAPEAPATEAPEAPAAETAPAPAADVEMKDA
ncbi:hypothetical protein CJU89_3479 [Yarrowia sp. B02]|nr:hypothetical protein CJU89_3479 [Yarrowia sp. B02]